MIVGKYIQRSIYSVLAVGALWLGIESFKVIVLLLDI